MFWFFFIRIDFASRVDSDLKLEFVAFASIRVFYTEIYCSNLFHVKVSKHKSFYLKLTTNLNQFNQIERNTFKFNQNNVCQT